MNRKKTITLMGPIPPPFGGVSVHLKRLMDLLSDDFDFKLIDESRIRKKDIFNLRSLNLFRYFKIVINADIVHIHSVPFLFRFFNFAISKLLRKKIVITIHAFHNHRSGSFQALLDGICFKKADRVIAVSKEIAIQINLSNIFIKEAFIPPVMNKENLELPNEISYWISKKRAEGYMICCANAWRLDEHNNEDLYGLDLCIMAANKLKSLNLKVAFIFIVCDLGGAIDIEKYRKTIIEFDMKSFFYLHESPVSFVNLLNECDVVLRPTNTDGDALTIREGLFFNKKVITSDVVLRPQGSIIFKNRNADSLVEAVISCLPLLGDNDTEAKENHMNDHQAYHDFYKKEIYEG